MTEALCSGGSFCVQHMILGKHTGRLNVLEKVLSYKILKRVTATQRRHLLIAGIIFPTGAQLIVSLCYAVPPPPSLVIGRLRDDKDGRSLMLRGSTNPLGGQCLRLEEGLFDVTSSLVIVAMFSYHIGRYFLLVFVVQYFGGFTSGVILVCSETHRILWR